MPEFIKRRLPILRAGTHRDSEGYPHTFTEEDLKLMVASYDPTRHEAPVVVGHPVHDAPAYGWVKSLDMDAGTLYAEADLLPEFDQLLQRGLFRKRSASFYKDRTLRHVGVLGAMPPAIKGLPDIKFGDDEAMAIEFQDMEKKPDRKGGTGMKFMDWVRQLAGKEGITLEDLPASFSESDVKKQVEKEVSERLTAERERMTTEFSEAQKAKEEGLKAREDTLRAKEVQARKDGVASFCEALQKEGKITPAMMKLGMGMTNFLESISSIDTTIEFGEGDGKKKQTPLEFMQSFLKGLPKAIEFGEVAGSDKDTGTGGDAEKREKLVSNFMEANPRASYKDAVLAVSKENPALFVDR